MMCDRAVRRPWAVWSPLLVPRLAWAAQGVAVRGPWSWGDFIGTMVIVGLLAALVVFFFWPRRPS
jgi:hypothetical protein